MNLLILLFLMCILPTDSPSDTSSVIKLRGKVESYRPDSYHINTGQARHLFMDTATIRVIEPAQYKDMSITLTLMSDKRAKWNRPHARFTFSISSEKLKRHLEDSSYGLSDVHMEDVVFEAHSP